MRPAVATLLSCFLLAALAACGGDASDPESTDPFTSRGQGDGPVRAGDGAGGGGESVLRFSMDRLNGDSENLAKYEGKVVLVVNTASQCGFTGQFEGLQTLYEEKRDDGLVILGFPADDIAGQEPLSDEQIEGFCKANFGVTFPMFAKINVVGDEAAPLFQALPEPTWNFNKYLLDRKGVLVEQWGAETTPEDAELTEAIDAQL